MTVGCALQEVGASVDLGVAALRASQRPEGNWEAECTSDPSFVALDTLGRIFLGCIEKDEMDCVGESLRSSQLLDGGWPAVYGGPGDLVVSCSVYAALRVVGDSPASDHMQRAQGFIRSKGGLRTAFDLPLNTVLAALGMTPWKWVPALRPEIVFLIEHAPVVPPLIFGPARGVFMPLIVTNTVKPVRDQGIRLEELSVPAAWPLSNVWARAVNDFVTRLPRIRHWHEKGVAVALNWTRTHQSADGTFGGHWISTLHSAIALDALGDPTDEQALDMARVGLKSFSSVQRSGGDFAPFTSCVASTAIATITLRMAGNNEDDRALARARKWLTSRQCRQGGFENGLQSPGPPDEDVIVRTGWAFECTNDVYPDADDTAVVIAALSSDQARSVGEVADALESGLRWMLSQQNRQGAWAAFSTYPHWLNRLFISKYLDKVAVVELPSPGITARCMTAILGLHGSDNYQVERAASWLVNTQRKDGTWVDRWTTGYVLSTACVASALASLQDESCVLATRRAVDWLLVAQNSDGGWGSQQPVSIFPRFPVGRRAGVLDKPPSPNNAKSTVIETATALTALLLSRIDAEESISRAVRFLLDRQRPDGMWDDPWSLWVLIADHLFFSYPFASSVFALWSLVEYERARGYRRTTSGLLFDSRGKETNRSSSKVK